MKRLRQIANCELRKELNLFRISFFAFLFLLLVGCGLSESTTAVPTSAVAAQVATFTPVVPPTFTPEPATAVAATSAARDVQINSNAETTPDATRFIPTNTPVTPSATPTETPTATPYLQPTATYIIKPFDTYAYDEIMPYEVFPVPPNNNGWGMHWVPTSSQEGGAVDRFVAEVVRMNIKWVVFLNGPTDTTGNDYLVERLVANGIMPVMRIYQSAITPYGDLVPMVRHFRAKGVYYFQIYNEPNVNIENTTAFANPNQYAVAWASAARQIVSAGGFPGIGAFSPGGEYNHYDFLDRTLRALEFNDDLHLLNHAWLSVHNYHGTRPYDDPDGFLLFRQYDEIVRAHIGRSLPIIGTEGGSYSEDPNVETQFIRYQYGYMKYNREPFFLAFSWWILANREGGGFDDTWEWQALFQTGGFVHPAITEYFYTGG